MVMTIISSQEIGAGMVLYRMHRVVMEATDVVMKALEVRLLANPLLKETQIGDRIALPVFFQRQMFHQCEDVALVSQLPLMRVVN